MMKSIILVENIVLSAQKSTFEDVSQKMYTNSTFFDIVEKISVLNRQT